MNFKLNDPFPFFRLGGSILYLAAENPHLFEISIEVLRDYQWHDEETDDDDDDVEIDLDEHDPDVEDVERMRTEPHPFGRATSVVMLANRAARERFALAEPLTEEERAGFGDALDEFADFADVVSDEIANSEPLEAVLARPWPRSASEDAARVRALRWSIPPDNLPVEDVEALRKGLKGTPLADAFERVLAASDLSEPST